MKKSKNKPAPDISYFARRGGLSPSGRTYAYKLATGAVDYIAESCNSTATVNHHVSLGLEMAFSDADAFRAKCEQFRIKVDRKKFEQAFPQLAFLDKLPAGPPSEAAVKAFREIESRWPELAQWPPKKLHRPGRPKDVVRNLKKRLIAQARGRNTDIAVDVVVQSFSDTDLKTPRSWQKRGCPADYRLAFNNPGWRVKIQKEISNLK